MAIAFVNAVSTSGAGPMTTGSIDTTGANLLVVAMSCDDAYNTAPTDSKSNSWTQLTSYTQTNVRVRMWYSVPTSVGTGHTFSASGGAAGAIYGIAFSGVAQTSPADQQNGANGFLTSIQPGSITPTENGEVIVTVLGINAAGSPMSINSGFTEVGTEHEFAAGVSYGGTAAYLIQTTAAAINPTWTRTNENGMATTQASFKAAAAAATATYVPQLLTLNVG